MFTLLPFCAPRAVVPFPAEVPHSAQGPPQVQKLVSNQLEESRALLGTKLEGANCWVFQYEHCLSTLHKQQAWLPAQGWALGYKDGHQEPWVFSPVELDTGQKQSQWKKELGFRSICHTSMANPHTALRAHGQMKNIHCPASSLSSTP